MRKFYGSTSTRWLPFRNDSSETIPAFAVLRVTGCVTVSNQNVLTVAKPDGTNAVVAFNGPQPVASGDYGECTQDFPAQALYDTADGTPSNGNARGPGNGTWKLVASDDIYTVVGTVDTTTFPRVYIVPAQQAALCKLGVLDADLTYGGTVTVSIYAGTQNSEVDTGENVTAACFLLQAGDSIASGSRVVLNRTADGWQVIAAECPDSGS